MTYRPHRNNDPFSWPFSALPVLFRQRRELLALPTQNRSHEWWRKRQSKLSKLDDAIRRFMAYM